LIDEILVLAFDAQTKFGFLESCPFFKQSTVHRHELSLQHFTFICDKYQLPAILKFSSQLLECFCDFVVTSSGLSSLARLASSETDEGIRVISLLMSLKLESGMQWLIASLLSP
jgi:hypothetical protein